MGLSRLLLLSLIASAAVSTFAAQSDPASPVCDLSIIAPKLARHCQSDPDVPSFLLSPTAQCCEALVGSLPAQIEMALPCLCRAAADPRLVAARLDVPRIFALYRRCVKGSFRRGPSFANQYCEEEDIETEKCNAANLATRVSRYCVINGKITSACCLAVVPTVVYRGHPSCLCRVAAQPQLAAAGLNGTGILELYAACGGTNPVGSHLVDFGGGVPCLCRAAVEHVTISAGLKATDLLAIYNACGGLRLGGAEHKAAAASCEGYGVPLPLPPTGKAATIPLQQNHDGGAIRIGPNTLPETAMT